MENNKQKQEEPINTNLVPLPIHEVMRPEFFQSITREMMHNILNYPDWEDEEREELAKALEFGIHNGHRLINVVADYNCNPGPGYEVEFAQHLLHAAFPNTFNPHQYFFMELNPHLYKVGLPVSVPIPGTNRYLLGKVTQAPRYDEGHWVMYGLFKTLDPNNTRIPLEWVEEPGIWVFSPGFIERVYPEILGVETKEPEPEEPDGYVFAICRLDGTFSHLEAINRDMIIGMGCLEEGGYVRFNQPSDKGLVPMLRRYLSFIAIKGKVL